jgi:7-carboxy-7-deazaguanine synthase
MNNQLPERKEYREDGMLEVHSIFDTIQGEGPLAGTPATFIRLAGCNLQCVWCDTEYTERTLQHPADIATQCNQNLVVITGGEPMRQNLVPLVMRLRSQGKYYVQVETNGTIFDEDTADCVNMFIVSPKTQSIDKRWGTCYANHAALVHYKVLYGPAFPSQPDNKGGIPDVKADYFQPVACGDPKVDEDIVQETVRHCIKTNTKLSLQLHKILNIP